MTEAIPWFANHLPVRIGFGEGRAAELPTMLAGEGFGSVLVIMDAGTRDHNDAVARCVDAVVGAGIDVAHFEKPAGEPTDAIVDQAASAVAGARPHAIVAIGGGSVIDTAKAARLCAGQATTVADFLRSERRFDEPRTPLIAIPTTAGTGSEVSGGAVITELGSGRKSGIAHPNLRAQHAIVDPVLTYSLPAPMTAFSGIDAVAQAIAGIVARAHTPIGDAIALESIRLAADSLVAAHRDGGDARARSAMACASLMAGLTMNISDCAAEHSLAQAIASRFPAPHGLTIGLVLAETLERECEHVPERLERVADALGVADDGSRDGSRAVSGVERLLADLDFPVLSSLGVTDADLDGLAELALEDFFITQSPAPWSHGEARDALAAALAREAR